MNRPVTVSRSDARRFLRRVHLIDRPAGHAGEVLSHHGFVQIDPINVCGRMQDHILRNRVAAYREGGLMEHLHGAEQGPPKPAAARTAFEHHHPAKHILAAFPLEAWPHMRGAMRERTRHRSAWMGRLTQREREMAQRILDRLSSAGPVGPEDFGDDRKAHRGWGSATLSKATLQKLFFHGRLLIAARENNRRLYDLPERVLPKETLELPESSEGETARWLALLGLRQHRLAPLSRAELKLIGDLVTPVRIDGCPALHCLTSDLAFMEGAGPVPGIRLLAPLDPMIYRRPVAKALWDFDYTWEVYTPPHKRKRGYYALPVLAGLEIVGHVDLAADRKAGRLAVVSRGVRRGHATAGPVAELSRFLGLGR